jgi:hypothetical protein
MRIENLWCVHVRTTRRADTPCTGVGKRVGAILGKSVLVPGARLSRRGPERVETHHPGRQSLAALGAISTIARGALPRRGAGSARRRLQRGDPRCLCIFRSLIQNGILTHDRAVRGTPDRSWGFRRKPRQAWLDAASRRHSPSGRSVTARLNRGLAAQLTRQVRHGWPQTASCAPRGEAAAGTSLACRRTLGAIIDPLPSAFRTARERPWHPTTT